MIKKEACRFIHVAHTQSTNIVSRVLSYVNSYTIKKSMLIALSVCLLLSLNCMAENTVDVTAPPAPTIVQEIPPQEIPDTMPAGEIPSDSQAADKAKTHPAGRGQNPAPAFNPDMQGAPITQGRPDNMNFPASNNMQNAETESIGGLRGFLKTYSTPVISVVILALAFIFVKLYKRKQY